MANDGTKSSIEIGRKTIASIEHAIGEGTLKRPPTIEEFIEKLKQAGPQQLRVSGKPLSRR